LERSELENADVIMRTLTFVEAESPVDGLDQTLADCCLISFERWQDVLKLVFADD